MHNQKCDSICGEDMEIKYIAEFCILANTLNYSQAAEVLYISPSTLSKHICTLERELGFNLFTRTTRTVILNDNGKTFLNYARQIVKIDEEYRSTVEKKKNSQKVRIGANYHLNELIIKAQKALPKVKFSIVEEDPSVLSLLMKDDKIDMCIIWCPTEMDPLNNYDTLIKDELCLMVPAAHRLANSKYVKLADLKTEKFVLINESHATTRKILYECERAGFTPNTVMEADHSSQVIDFVSHGMGITIITERESANLVSEKVKKVQIIPKIPLDVYICTMKDRTLSSQCLKFYQCLKDQADDKKDAEIENVI